MNAIEVKDLTKAYRDFTLGPLSFSLPEGCILGLVGENGAGKSTTIRALLGMAHKDGGSVALCGRESGEDLRATKEEIGVVLDDVGIPACLTARQVGNVMAKTFANWDAQTFTALLQKLSLPKNKPFRDFSRGMRMKLGIAVALSHHARLLLLDEPTAGLDPVVRDEVVEMLLDFTRDEKHTVLISSHIVSDLEKLCDYVAFLHEGKLLLFEEKDKLREEYGMLCCDEAEFRRLPTDAVLYCAQTPYNVQALVRRDALPPGAEIQPVSLEELFVFMVKQQGRELAQ